MSDSQVLVRVQGLKKYFPITRGVLIQRQVGAVRAVDDVSFDICQGETLGLVGESGCGKTTTGRLILRLVEPTAGQVCFEGDNILGYSPKQMLTVRRKMQIIFQDPYASLNPRMRVEEIVGEGLLIHKLATNRRERKEKVRELLQQVGLQSEHLYRYPHEFSGGQRQRIGIARALALHPEFVVADEPISALDVSIQAQIINLLQDLQQQLGLTYLFISHDLRVVKHISNWVAVMYLGKIVEMAPCAELYAHPLHPYTQSLLAAIPVIHHKSNAEPAKVSGESSGPANTPDGCRFYHRCSQRAAECQENAFRLKSIASGHLVACRLY